MTATANPYAAPQARVEDIHDNTQTQAIKLWSAKGRMGRLRYFAWPLLMSFVLVMPVALLSGIAGGAGFEMVAMVLIGVAYLAAMVLYALVTIQRCHDIGWTGWAALLALIPLMGLIFLFIPGTPGSNRFGARPPPNPRGLGWVAGIAAFLFVVGILAAIALPAYQDYTARARAGQSQGK